MLAVCKRILDGVGAVERFVGMALIVLIVVTVTIQVFTRYVFGQPITWVEELATYAFIWGVFLGASVGLKEARHIRIETFVARLPPRGGAAFRLLGTLLVAALLVVLVEAAFRAMAIEGRSRSVALPIDIPRMWFYSVPLAVSSLSMLATCAWLAAVEILALAGRPAPGDAR